jgi:hypothetical protein
VFPGPRGPGRLREGLNASGRPPAPFLPVHPTRCPRRKVGEEVVGVFLQSVQPLLTSSLYPEAAVFRPPDEDAGWHPQQAEAADTALVNAFKGCAEACPGEGRTVESGQRRLLLVILPR